MQVFFIFFLMLIQFIVKEAKIISQKYTLQKGKYYLAFNLGENNYQIFKSINLKSKYTTTIIHSDILKLQLNDNKKIEMTFNNQTHIGYIIHNSISIPKANVVIGNFVYYYFERTYEHPFLNCIGLGYNTKGKEYSLLNKLYESNHINHLSFSVSSLDSIHNNGTLYYGGIPTELFQGKHKGSCKIPKNQSNWSCNLLHVSIESYDYVYNPINNYSCFQTNHDSIQAPLEFLKKFNDLVLYPLIMRGKCFVCDPIVYNVIKCFDTVKGHLPILLFNFDNDLLIKVDMNNLLQCEKNGLCDIMIEENHINPNEWVFGTSFLGMFDILFDEENQKITFYTDKDILIQLDNSGSKERLTIRLLMVICISIGGMGIVINLLMIYNNKIYLIL